MAEIRVDIIVANAIRGSSFESIVDIYTDGILLFGGGMLTFSAVQSDEQIFDAAIARIYTQLIESNQAEE